MKTTTLEKVHVGTAFEHEGKTYIKKAETHRYPDIPNVLFYRCVDVTGAVYRIAATASVKAKWASE